MGANQIGGLGTLAAKGVKGQAAQRAGDEKAARERTFNKVLKMQLTPAGSVMTS